MWSACLFLHLSLPSLYWDQFQISRYLLTFCIQEVEIIINFLVNVKELLSLSLNSCPTLCDPMNCSTPGLCPSPTPGSYSNSCPLSQWCHPTISSSVVPFSSHLQSFPASESSSMSQLFASGGQSIGFSALVNIQDWFPLGWTGWISLQSKGLLRVFSNTTVQKCQFFSAQLSL